MSFFKFHANFGSDSRISFLLKRIHFLKSFFSLKMENFEKTMHQKCNKTPRYRSLFEKNSGIWPKLVKKFCLPISLLSLFSLQWFRNFHCFIAMNENAKKIPSIFCTIIWQSLKSQKMCINHVIFYSVTLIE